MALLPLRTYYDQMLQKNHASDEDRTRNLHVTDLNRCPCGVWLEKTGRFKRNEGESGDNESRLRRFEVGHTIEAEVGKSLSLAGLVVGEHTRLEWPEYNMVGSLDRLLCEGGQYTVVEIKSIHPFALDKMVDSVTKKMKPHEHYVEQLMLYMEKLKVKYPNIKGKLFYFSLDGRTAEFDIEYDGVVIAKAHAKAKALHEAITKGIRPEAAPDLVQENGKWSVNWKAKYCQANGSHNLCSGENFADEDMWYRAKYAKLKKLYGSGK